MNRLLLSSSRAHVGYILEVDMLNLTLADLIHVFEFIEA